MPHACFLSGKCYYPRLYALEETERMLEVQIETAVPSISPASRRPDWTHEKMLFFNERAERWDVDHRCPDGDRLIPLIIPFLRLERGNRVLDLGCGTGKLVPCMSETLGPSGTIVEADFCHGMLHAGQKKGFGSGVRFIQMDAHFPAVRAGRFDRMICFSLFPHLEDPAGALREFRRILKPGSPLVVAHTMGREDLNAFFRRSGGPIANDRLPENTEMISMMSRAGFRSPEIADRPKYYIARAWA
jgi:SAM-dependent methyltransferase